MSKQLEAKEIIEGTASQIDILHFTGGARAICLGQDFYKFFPVLGNNSVKQILKISFKNLNQLTNNLNIYFLGRDSQVNLDGSIINRIWIPRSYLFNSMKQPADVWRSIANSADEKGDKTNSIVANHISYSLMSAGIKLRDASDCYHTQLIGALTRKEENGQRFANIQMHDIELAIHSLLSELSSARDYISTFFAKLLEAPDRTDSLVKLKAWAKKDKRAQEHPVIKKILITSEEKSHDRWLYLLAQYRNLYTHRQPMGSVEDPCDRRLIYKVIEYNGHFFPCISMPLSKSDKYPSQQDALTFFMILYNEMLDFAKFAADHTPYDNTFIQTIVSK